MGHLLGAPPARAASSAGHVIGQSHRLQAHWVEVESVALLRPAGQSLAGFAIDSPRTGDRSRGAGIEVNGWVIGREEPVRGVRAVSDGRIGPVMPLDVRRPDVLADYPETPHARQSGFSLWVPLVESIDAWHFTLEAILASGDVVPLAEVQGRAATERVAVSPGTRPVTAPDFVIIGAQRAGTTSLHAYLSTHPHVATAPVKELHYFTDRYQRGFDWYLGQFPAELPLHAITGEATPYALFHPLAPQRLRAVAPQPRLIALLRNPVDRAYSQYRMERARGDEALDFAAAVAAESDRLRGEEERLAADPAAQSYAHQHQSYLARGEYARQLERWLAHVPRDQLLVLRSEDLYARPKEAFEQIATFLGIDRNVNVPFPIHNRSAGPALDPAIRADLESYFAPRNARLARLLGWDPMWDDARDSSVANALPGSP